MGANKEYMTDAEAKQAILDIGKRMYINKFVAANDGNISCKVGENEIWVTPTGVSKGYMTEDMLVKMDLDGNILEGTAKPSSEIKMHIRVYKENPELKAVTHAHPPISTAYAVAGVALDKPILIEGALLLGVVPIAKYATTGTEEVPESIGHFVKGYNAVLLANHGALTWGRDIYEAFYRLEAVENYAKIMMYTGFIGKRNLLSTSQVNDLLEIRKKLGITSGGIPKTVDVATNLEDVYSND